MEGMQNTCKCPHHKVMPLVMILVGLILLSGALGWISWTVVLVILAIAIIVKGIMKLTGSMGMCKCCAPKM